MVEVKHDYTYISLNWLLGLAVLDEQVGGNND